MNPYPLLRPVLFHLDHETTHVTTLKLLKLAYLTGLSPLIAAPEDSQPVTVMGLKFSNPVGLAAGLDKNGDYINALGAMGRL